MSRSRLGSSMPQGKRKRAMDVVASSVGLLLASPFLIIACVLVWLEDRRNPFYVASRVGRAGLGCARRQTAWRLSARRTLQGGR